jgi:hypothetical protein
VPGSAEQIYLLRMAGGDLEGARTDLNTALAQDHEPWWDLQELYFNKLGTEDPAAELTPDEEATLNILAATPGQGAVQAAAWLAAAAGECISTVVILPGTGTRMFMGGKGSEADLLPVVLGVYPNPTQGEAFITYQLPEGAERGWLDVRDAMGRVVYSKAVAGTSGIVQLPKAMLAAGVYAAALKADGIQVASSKFIALR